MRANLADKHELVVTGCPLCDFNALSPVNGGQVILVTEAVPGKMHNHLRCSLLPANFRFLSVNVGFVSASWLHLFSVMFIVNSDRSS